MDTTEDALIEPPPYDIDMAKSVAINPKPEILTADSTITVPEGLEVEHEVEFRWNIQDWSVKKKDEKLYSPEFTCKDSRWRILLFPKGNRTAGFVSCFLESLDSSEKSPEEKWYRCVAFSIAVCNSLDPRVHNKANAAFHRFNPKETDWGFSQLLSHQQLHTPFEKYNRPILENDAFTLIVFLKQIRDETGVLWHNFADWDSKSETGFVGLKNQGATCYLNSLLQSLYYTNYFRKATYCIPTENDEPTKSVAYALQRLFYHMQHSSYAVGTQELTKSFGWDTMDAFHQHDVQELNRVLQDNLENTMKGTPVEGAIRKLFTGKMKSYIQCVDVDYESSRVEDFYDIQLNVKGCKNLYESFVDYCAVETLDGDNKYFAEGYGLQNAKKGVIFKSFPPVLHLQLKRFDYDMMNDRFIKINDRHEFGMTLDIDDFLDSDADRSVKQHYRLQGVLVHSGDLNAGHYFALIRPDRNGNWFKYDDDKVIPVTEREVLDGNFGGEIPPTNISSNNKIGSKFFTNAYMLVYVRECDEEEILGPVTDEDIPLHLRERVKRDLEESERQTKELQERHLYLNVLAVIDSDLHEYNGFDIGFPQDKTAPLSSDSVVLGFRKKKEMLISELLRFIADSLNLFPEQIRMWNVVSRQNKTSRIDAVIEEEFYGLSLADFRAKVSKDQDIRIFVQTSKSQIGSKGGVPLYFPPIYPNSREITIFLKLYNPLTLSLSVRRTIVAKQIDKLKSIIPILQAELPGAEPSEILIFEEVKPGMIDRKDFEETFEAAELVDGDILCFQRELQIDEVDKLADPQFATVPGYFDFMWNRVGIAFLPRYEDKYPDQQRLQLTLSLKMDYDSVLLALGSALSYDPAKIRLFSTSPNNVSMKYSIKRDPKQKLLDILGNNQYGPPSYTFFYELLEVSLIELESMKTVSTTFIDEEGKQSGPHPLLIPKAAKFEELIKIFGKIIKLPANYRIFEVVQSRKQRVFKLDDFITLLNEFGLLVVEAISDEEVQIQETEPERIIHGFHFSKETFRAHGIPFTFILNQNELLSETKQRLAKKLHISKNELERVKIGLVSKNYSHVSYLDDDAVLANENIEGCLIGVDHVDKARSRVANGGGIKIN